MLKQKIDPNIAQNYYRLEVKTKRTGTGSENDPVTTPIQLIVDWNNIENKPPLDNSGIGEVTANVITLNSHENATAEVVVTKNEVDKDLEFKFGIPRGRAGVVVSEVEPEDKDVVWLNPNGLGDEYVFVDDFNQFIAEYEKFYTATQANITKINQQLTTQNNAIIELQSTDNLLKKQLADIQETLTIHNTLFDRVQERLLALEDRVTALEQK